MAGRKTSAPNLYDHIMKKSDVKMTDSQSIPSSATRKENPYVNSNSTDSNYEDVCTNGTTLGTKVENDYDTIQYDKLTIRAQSRQSNIIYESASSDDIRKNERTNTTKCCCNIDAKKAITKDWIFCFILIVSLLSFLLVVLTIFGVVGPNCSSCEHKKVYRNAENVKDDRVLAEKIRVLEKNISKLAKERKTMKEDRAERVKDDRVLTEKIRVLEKNISTLMRIMANFKKGPPGSQGLSGPQGPMGPHGSNGSSGSGASTFTRCTHGFLEKSAVSSIQSSTAIRYMVEQNKVVVGATCSTVGGDETNLDVGTTTKKQTVYLCTCAGQSSYTHHSTRGSIKCRIDYWVCPRT